MSSTTRLLLDRAYLREQTFGDNDLERELLRLFEGQCRRLLPKIADPTIPTNDRLDAAHALKGAARAIGAGAVADLAHAIEEALASSHDGEHLKTFVPDLERAVADTLAEVARVG